MSKKKAYAISFIILLSLASFLPTVATGWSSATQFNIDATETGSINAIGSLEATYTLFIPSPGFAGPAILSELGSIGLSPKIVGSLAYFQVPIQRENVVNLTLFALSKEYGISYFSSTASLIAYPQIQALNFTAPAGIPFAYTPSQISTAYNFTWASEHGLNGAGQTIVIVDAYGDPNLAYDIKAFDAVSGLPSVNLSIIYPNGKPGVGNATWAMETATDVEWAHALAPAARIILAVSPSAYTTDLQSVVSDVVEKRMGNIVTLSWGTPEVELSAGALLTFSQIYRQANQNGMVILAASGDLGAYSGTSQLSVNFPAADPFVTAVGGTSLYYRDSAYQQYGWGGIYNGESFGSGGGFSSAFPVPYWQNATGFNGTHRGVPDVAVDADRYTGMYVISGGAQYIVGGTSIASPIWADVVALISQSLGYPLPSLNPLIYQVARTDLYNSSFTQILKGSNGYYSNGPGWNPVTGLGTPKVSGLINATDEIMKGYGGVVLLNGSRTYNGSSVSANLTVSVNETNLVANGTSFYYVGLYYNQSNYIKFGVAYYENNTYLRLSLKQGNSDVVRSFPLPYPYSGNLSNYTLRLSITPSSIIVSSSGGFQHSIQAFMENSGNMVPAVGVEQLQAETNFSVLGPATFYGISILSSGKTVNITQAYFEKFSGLASPWYSSVGAVISGNNLTFYHSGAGSSGFLRRESNFTPIIQYTMSYSDPISAIFSLSGISEGVSWLANGTPFTSGDMLQFPAQGGAFNITAVYTDALGSSRKVNRTIEIPAIRNSNLTVGSPLAYFPHPAAIVTILWFYSYEYPSYTSIPMLVGVTSPVSAASVSGGYYENATESPALSSLNISLYPRNVNVSIFAFPGDAVVTINGNETTQSGGWHYASLIPGGIINLTVTAKGLRSYTGQMTLTPGGNVSVQITLAPSNESAVSLSGIVSDLPYSFSLQGALVSLGNLTYSYTNSTGWYILFAPPGKYNLSASEALYQNYSSEVNITTGSLLNIRLTPSQIALNTSNLVTITSYFPLLFYFGFVSWTQYNGNNFSSYQIYVSNSPEFVNPNVITVNSQNTTYSFVMGILPTSTYYITIVLRLANDQVYQSQVVKLTYYNPLYLGINLVILGGIAFYVAVAYSIFRKKR